VIARAVAARGGAITFLPIAAVFAVAFAVTLGGAIQRASPSASPATTQDDQAATSAGLSLGVADVRPTVSADGSVVLSVHLTARVHATRTITVANPSTSRYPLFRLIPQGSIGVEGTYVAAPGSSPTLLAGSTTTYDLTFDFRGLSVLPPPGREVAIAGNLASAPGTWLLEMQLVDQAGLSYDVTTPVTIVAAS
jgi:hypothetical protein